MATPFDNLRVDSASVKRSMAWYQKQIASLKNIQSTARRAVRSGDAQMAIGGLYLFSYDPKHKDTLPYYDTMPLVLPFSKAPGGFLGINLHYLPYGLRFKLMGALLTLIKDISDPRSRAQVSWNLLNNSAKYPGVSACVKHYLTDHVKSSYHNIPNDQWLAAVMMPLEQFQGADKSVVYRDSRRKL
jgi:hypothetical protein